MKILLLWFTAAWEMAQTRPAPPLPSYEVHRAQSAITDGTLNRNGDKDRGWTLEAAIPWNNFDDLSRQQLAEVFGRIDIRKVMRER